MEDIEPWQLDALRRAGANYRQEVNDCYDEVLYEVHDRIVERGSVGKGDIGALVLWKRVQANTLWAARLLNTPESEVRAVTSRAVVAVQDQRLTTREAGGEARNALYGLHGFKHGDALASAVLTAIDPGRMAVFDRRASTSLKKLGLGFTGGYGGYLGLLGRLQERLSDETHTWTARDVDLGLFWLREVDIQRPSVAD